MRRAPALLVARVGGTAPRLPRTPAPAAARRSTTARSRGRRRSPARVVRRALRPAARGQRSLGRQASQLAPVPLLADAGARAGWRSREPVESARSCSSSAGLAAALTRPARRRAPAGRGAARSAATSAASAIPADHRHLLHARGAARSSASCEPCCGASLGDGPVPCRRATRSSGCDGFELPGRALERVPRSQSGWRSSSGAYPATPLRGRPLSQPGRCDRVRARPPRSAPSR